MLSFFLSDNKVVVTLCLTYCNLKGQFFAYSLRSLFKRQEKKRKSYYQENSDNAYRDDQDVLHMWLTDRYWESHCKLKQKESSYT